MLVDAEPRLAARCERDLPAAGDLACVRVGRNVLGARVREADAGLGYERADQRDGGLELFLGRVHALAEPGAVLPRERFEVLVDERLRERERRRRRVERVELHAEAILQRAARDADRIE